MLSKSLSRREILSRLGWGAAAVPLLHARAQGASAPVFPRRLVLFDVASCGPREFFWPRGTETDFTLAPMTTSLESVKSKLIFVANIASLSALGQSNYKIHESNLHILTGAKMVRQGDDNYAGGPSIDWMLANRVAELKARTFSQLVVGFNAGGWGNSHAAPKAEGGTAPEITRQEEPRSLFDQLFMGKPMMDGAVDPALARIRAERKSVLDYLAPSLTSYASRLGVEDRQKIDYHLDAVRALEKQLGAGGDAMAGCSSATRPVGGSFTYKPEKITEAKPSPAVLVQQQLDVVAAALSCDLTRVVTLQWGNDGGNNWHYQWLGPEFGGSPPQGQDPVGTGLISQHYLQHESWKSKDLTAMRAKMESWWVTQFAYLANKLNSVPEGDGTMLDNTALVLIGAQGHPASHGVYGHPVIIAGSCGGYFKTGRFVKLGTRTDFNDPENEAKGGKDGMISHTRLLTSLVNAMGLDVPSVGMAGLGGPLGELRG